MKQTMPPITPQTGYLVTTKTSDFQLNFTVFASLYQPLLSPLAYVLESILATQLQVNPTLADRRRHSDLLSILNAGTGKLESARDQLEAVGLLRTFFQDDEIGPVFVYELQPLLSASQVFEEDILSTKLLQTVGEQRFKDLAKAVRQYYYDPRQMTETTHSFFDVFTPDQAELAADSQLTSNVQQQLRQPQKQELVPNDKFDFTLLAKQLVHDGLDEDDVQASCKLIMTQHLMYGIAEPQMRQLVLQAVNWGVNNKIDPRQFKLVVANSFQAPSREKPEPTVKPFAEEITGLSNQEQQLVKVAQDLAPVTFLATLKQQTGGGFVTSSEKYIISNLLNQGLAPEVVNILSYDVIVQQELPTLRKNLVDTIANSWQRSNVGSASAALKEIKNFNQPTKRTRTARKYRPRGGRVKEQLPDWATKKDHQSKTKASAAQLRESQQLLAKLKQKHDNKNK